MNSPPVALTLSRAICEAFRNYLITMAVLAVAFVIGRAVADWMNL
jgi:hypothetical protein